MEGSVNIGGVVLQRREALGIWETDGFSMERVENTESLIIETPVNLK